MWALKHSDLTFLDHPVDLGGRPYNSIIFLCYYLRLSFNFVNV